MFFGTVAFGQTAFSSPGFPGVLIEPSGFAVASSIGSNTVLTSSTIIVSGLAQTMSVGSFTIIGTAKVEPTGIATSFTVATPNTLIWNDVSKGTSQTWVEVEIAA